MKLQVSFVTASLVAVAWMLPQPAKASCEGVCYMGYRACIASGQSDAVCEQRLDMCLQMCEGGIACNMDQDQSLDKDIRKKTTEHNQSRILRDPLIVEKS